MNRGDARVTPDARRGVSQQLRSRPGYGVGSAYDPPKISKLPNVAGHACCGAGCAIDVSPVRSARRHVSLVTRNR